MILSAQIEVRKAVGPGYTYNVWVDGRRLLPILGGAPDVKSAFERAVAELRDYPLAEPMRPRQHDATRAELRKGRRS